MANLVRGSKLSSGTLGMRFMQRKAEQELQEQLKERRDAQLASEQWKIKVDGGSAGRKGLKIIQDQRRYAVATAGQVNAGRRTFGVFKAEALPSSQDSESDSIADSATNAGDNDTSGAAAALGRNGLPSKFGSAGDSTSTKHGAPSQAEGEPQAKKRKKKKKKKVKNENQH